MWPRVRIPRWIVTRVKIPRWNVTPAHNSTLNCVPGSWFHVEVRPQVSIQRWIVTPSHDSTLDCHLVLGSQFNVEFWPRVIIQRGILTRGYNSTWNSDPSTYLVPVELRLKKVSKFNSVIKIQQLRRVTIQRKIHWILTPGRYSIGGSKFYLTRISWFYCWERSFFGDALAEPGKRQIDWAREKCAYKDIPLRQYSCHK